MYMLKRTYAKKYLSKVGNWTEKDLAWKFKTYAEAESMGNRVRNPAAGPEGRVSIVMMSEEFNIIMYIPLPQWKRVM
jgi:hypothetical protein